MSYIQIFILLRNSIQISIFERLLVLELLLLPFVNFSENVGNSLCRRNHAVAWICYTDIVLIDYDGPWR